MPPLFAKVFGERQGSEGSYPQRASFSIIIDWEILSPTRIVRFSVRSFSGRGIFVLIAPEEETNIPTESDINDDNEREKMVRDEKTRPGTLRGSC